jgi:hypothetical protein
MAELMTAKTGEVPAAFNNPHIGEGTPKKQYKDGYGLSHIALKHPAVVDRLPELIPQLIPGDVKGGNRLEMTTADHRAIAGLDWFGEEKKWLLTAYRPGENEPPPPEGFSGVTSAPEGGTGTTTPLRGGLPPV